MRFLADGMGTAHVVLSRKKKILAFVDKPLAATRRNVSVTLTIPKKLRKSGKFTVTVTRQRAARQGAVQEHAHPGGEEVNRSTRSVCLALGALAISAAPAVACVNVGVYQDKPASTLPALQKKAGKNVKTVSTYLTVGHALDPKLVKLARTNGVQACSSAGCPTRAPTASRRPGYRLSAIAAGKFDKDLKALALQIKALPHGAIVRPMPDPNTPWYAWSGTVNGNRPGDYVPAWKHVRKVLTQDRGQEGQAALERRTRAACPTTRRTRSRCTSRAPSRSTSSAPTPTTSATRRASPGRPRPTCSCRPTAPSRSSRQEAVLDLRDGLDRPRRRRGRLDRRARTARQDHAEAGRGRLVRRPRQHRRLPRDRARAQPQPRSRRSSRRVQVWHPQP